MGDVTGDPTDGTAALVEVFSAFGGDALRDVWVFDQSGYEAAYLREDVEQRVDELDVSMFVDNERYGYITRETYADLHYASYEYTVRGFDGFEQFRTFLADNGAKVGVFASFDRRKGGYDYATLQDEIDAVVAAHPVEAFTPDGD